MFLAPSVYIYIYLYLYINILTDISLESLISLKGLDIKIACMYALYKYMNNLTHIISLESVISRLKGLEKK